MKRKLFLALPSVAAVVLGIILLGFTPEVANSQSTGGIKVYSMLAGPAGGTWYMLATKMAELFNKEVKGMRINPEMTDAGSNYRVLGEKRASLAFGGNAEWYYAANGIGEKYKNKKYPDLRWVFSGDSMFCHIVVTQDSGIKSIADLKGKKINIGMPGSFTASSATPAVLKAYGISMTDIKTRVMTIGEGCDALKDGQIDATVMIIAPPAAAYMELSNTTNVKLLSLDEQHYQLIKKERPELERMTIPAGQYKEQKEEVTGLGLVTCLLTLVEIPEDFIYQFVKVVMEHPEDLRKAHAAGKFWNKEYIYRGAMLPFHPGAEKYYREAGLWKK